MTSENNDMKSEEPLPISEKITPIEYYNLYKTDKWWSAVVLAESFGRRHIAFYLWIRKKGKWKRMHKWKIQNRGEWLLLKDTVEKLVLKL